MYDTWIALYLLTNSCLIVNLTISKTAAISNALVILYFDFEQTYLQVEMLTQKWITMINLKLFPWYSKLVNASNTDFPNNVKLILVTYFWSCFF